MKKLSIINEGMWTSSLKRSQGEEVRKEDKFKSIDFCLSVLWADKDLVIDGQELFSWDEIHDYELSGWRLPTQKEFNDLLGFKSLNVERKFDEKIATITHTNNGKRIEFYAMPDMKFAQCLYLTGEKKVVGEKIFSVCMRIENITGQADAVCTYVVYHSDKKFRVRLVKDKD